MIYPRVMNAPGGSTNKSMFVVSGSMLIPNSVPLPSSSLTMPNRVRANVNPMPQPIPSRMLSNGEFLHAKASARPRIMQLTTMSGMYIPNAAFIEGRYAARSICNMVTNVAMTTMKTGILTLSGVRFFISDMTKLEHISTNIVANPIEIPLMADVVVAKVGHMPSRRTNVGFSFNMPLSSISCLDLFIFFYCHFCFIIS